MHKTSTQDGADFNCDIELDETLINNDSADLQEALAKIRKGSKANRSATQKPSTAHLDPDLNLDSTLINNNAAEIQQEFNKFRQQQQAKQNRQKPQASNAPDLNLDSTLVGNPPGMQEALEEIRRRHTTTKPISKPKPEQEVDDTVLNSNIAEALKEVRRQNSASRAKSGPGIQSDEELDLVLTNSATNSAKSQYRKRRKGINESEGKLLKLGETLPCQRYTIKAFLSRSGDSELYLARDKMRGSNVTLKALSTRAASSIREQFLQNAQAACKLSHAHIVPTYDVQEENGLAYFTMEPLKGQSLRKAATWRWEHQQPFTEAEILKLTDQICGALTHAHKKGVVHGNINLDTLSVDSQSHYTLMDFGSSVLDDRSSHLYFRAPEQRNESRSQPLLSGDVDQYALAAVLYELLAGEQLTGRNKPLRSLRSDLSNALCTAIERALNREPAQRYSDIGHLQAALHGQSYTVSQAINASHAISPLVTGLIIGATLIAIAAAVML